MNSGWSIGISSQADTKLPNPAFYFAMQSDRSGFSTVVYDMNKYSPNIWKHITVTYDEKAIRMYVGKTLVATSHEQHGKLFGSISRKCKEIRLGGGMDGLFGFRGAVDDIVILNTSLPHDLIDNQKINSNLPNENVSLFEPFNNTKGWRKASKFLAKLVKSDVSVSLYDFLVRKPYCGKTICDDPVLMTSYLNNNHLRSYKALRYRVVNIFNDNGSDPLISIKDLSEQHKALQSAFNKYNISWTMDPIPSYDIHNTSLREKFVMMACDPWDIGDGICNKECVHSRTGYDGGDCEPYVLPCVKSKLGNGVCDPECNKEFHLWDLGDCCGNDTSSHLSCFDPKSEYRGYLGIDEFKKHIDLDGTHHLNVYLASRAAADFVGLSTMPWDKSVYGVLGGVVVQKEAFGRNSKSKGLVHEIGHVLGLWHVHRGISEMDCNDPCLENVPSMELGDLCSDTLPTPSNKLCQDPDGITSSCGISTFHNTPFRNYMSYAGPPDAEPCELSDMSWIPDAVSCGPLECYLELSFAIPIVPNRKSLRMTCQEDGEWHGEKCVRITCLPIDPVFTGLYSCTNLNYIGSRCTLRCPGGLGSQAIKCTPKGEWTSDFQMCPSGIQGSCPMLPTTDDMVFKCHDNYVGYQCEVTCTLPNSKPIMAGRTNKVRGRLNGPMATYLTVRQLTCTALSEWQPDPSTLMCVESCKIEYLSDGWCDAENNRQQCEWDGGDCCDSTSKDGVAMPFPETCKEECRCLDPSAAENQIKNKKKRKKKQKHKRRRKNKKMSKTKHSKTKSLNIVAQSVSFLENWTSIFGAR
ncbi:hypothetical protein FSP39_020751 [Pinctada imbricata]|uniref:LNR domain-containing protein n=1 Tax=Pinctada imbricata TaxID=66713 RepID=A0AA89BP16_PINIB|nr:hypothetical protein FSP39_020751 [Pinctada imbricata]